MAAARCENRNPFLCLPNHNEHVFYVCGLELFKHPNLNSALRLILLVLGPRAHSKSSGVDFTISSASIQCTRPFVRAWCACGVPVPVCVYAYMFCCFCGQAHIEWLK